MTRLLLAGSLVGVLTATGCSSSDDRGTDDVVDTGAVHVHGLGVDPADGALYAATHTGLFRVLDDGTATRVAGRYQDTMGFTVVGPRTFLGSGHPDLREDHPPQLGLIESTDAGETWRSLSLRGEADFHALAAVHGRVYGYDATTGALMVSADRRAMVSADRRAWDRRSTQRIAHFAVSPADPDELLATSEQGLLRSTDGGRGFSRVPARVLLALLAWPSAGDLYGVDPDGVVSHSADGGRTWARRGEAGAAPEALTVDPRSGDVHVALSDHRIVTSTDGGRTFTTRYDD